MMFTRVSLMKMPMMRMFSNQARHTGKVKYFNNEKGFGFIARAEGEGDVFVHQSQIKKDGFRSLRINEDVEFDVETNKNDPSKTYAVNVTGPGGADVVGTSKEEHMRIKDSRGDQFQRNDQFENNNEAPRERGNRRRKDNNY